MLASPSSAPAPGVHRPPPLAALTGIRFFAALYVVVFHYGRDAFAGAPWQVQAFLASGPSAVGLFYVLSGAVLVYSCTSRTGELATTRFSFWRARFARIYPLYLFALILDAPFFLSALVKTHDGINVLAWGVPLALAALALLQAWCPLSVFAWNTPGWSLSAEAFFYAVFPRLLPWVRVASAGQLVRMWALCYGLALIPPLCVVAVQLSADPLLQVRMPSGSGGLDLETWLVRFAGFSPIARLPEFIMGMALGWCIRTRPATLTRSAAASLELATLALLAVVLVALGSSADRRPWLDSGAIAPLFLALVAVLATGAGPVARILSTRPLQVLGDASYALYILQEPLLIWTSLLGIGQRVPPSVWLIFFVTVLTLASILSQRLIGEPVRKWILKTRHSTPDPSDDTLRNSSRPLLGS